jgi:hypothetical protein
LQTLEKGEGEAAALNYALKREEIIDEFEVKADDSVLPQALAADDRNDRDIMADALDPEE